MCVTLIIDKIHKLIFYNLSFYLYKNKFDNIKLKKQQYIFVEIRKSTLNLT